jgi:hypothetical protein
MLLEGTPTPLAGFAAKAGRFGQFHVGIDIVGEMEKYGADFQEYSEEEYSPSYQ